MNAITDGISSEESICLSIAIGLVAGVAVNPKEVMHLKRDGGKNEPDQQL